MKHFIISVFSLLALQGNSQLLDPADWEFIPTQVGTSAKVGISEPLESAEIGEIIALNLKVILDDSWYIYSNDQDPDVGPKPTEVLFEQHQSYELVDGLKPLKVKEKYDDIWMGQVRYIDESGGGFVQKIKILKDNPVIRGTIVYSVCSMVTGQCVFPEEEFEIKVLTP